MTDDRDHIRAVVADFRARYPELDNLLASYFMGDDELDDEVEALADDLDEAQLERFLTQARAAATEDEDAVEAFVRNTVNWDLGGGRRTLTELADRVEAAAESSD